MHNPRKILVVEDDPLQLELLRQHLNSLGLLTVPAQSIEAAWKHLEEAVVQLAILDVQLPDGSGLELCRRIDEDDRLTGLPVLILSSSTQADIVRQTRAVGGCYFIGKPYDPNVLFAVVESLLGEQL